MKYGLIHKLYISHTHAVYKLYVDIYKLYTGFEFSHNWLQYTPPPGASLAAVRTRIEHEAANFGLCSVHESLFEDGRGCLFDTLRHPPLPALKIDLGMPPAE